MSTEVTSTSSRIAGWQNWRHLVFLHWRVAAEQLQPHLPTGLTVETYDGSAWLGLVPFSMERVRPWWSPAVPGISWFLETNLRTYVRHESGLSAVWFFSLDANSRLAVRVARTFWNLNYIDCRMDMQFSQAKDSILYTGQRIRTPDERYEIQVELPNQEPRPAQEESLEHFLLERYTLLTQTRRGNFLAGQVSHEPYSFVSVSAHQCSESLTARILNPKDTYTPPVHVVYSPGVDVRVSQLQPVT